VPICHIILYTRLLNQLFRDLTGFVRMVYQPPGIEPVSKQSISTDSRVIAFHYNILINYDIIH